MKLRWIAVPVVVIVLVSMLFLATVGWSTAVPDVNPPLDDEPQPTAYGIVTIPIVIKPSSGTMWGFTGIIGTDPFMPIVPIRISDYVSLNTGQVYEKHTWNPLQMSYDGGGGGSYEPPPGPPPVPYIPPPRLTYWVTFTISGMAENINWTSEKLTVTDYSAVSDTRTHVFESGRVFFQEKGSYILTMTLWSDYQHVVSGISYTHERATLATMTYPFQVTV